MAATKSLTASIIRGCGWQSEAALFSYLENLPQSSYASSGFVSMETFLTRLRTRINHIEHEGQVVRETREMTLPGNF